MDNALSRDLFPQDYNCLGDNENRPVKWLSVEAILEKKFTPASDVVSLAYFAASKLIFFVPKLGEISFIFYFTAKQCIEMT